MIVMDLAVNVRVVLFSCMGDSMGNMAVETNKDCFHGGLDQVGEVRGLLYAVKCLVAFCKDWGKRGSAHLEPPLTLLLVYGGGEFSCF